MKSFQPTRPLRGATDGSPGYISPFGFQPTRPLRGATICIPPSSIRDRFQPTRPLRGATAALGLVLEAALRFQPTRPLRGATQTVAAADYVVGISTHAPLAGRDQDIETGEVIQEDFNPRAPCGARRRRARPRPRPLRDFNPRAPCGARQSLPLSTCRMWDFNPRAPCGARPCSAYCRWMLKRFQPTRPLRGATDDQQVALVRVEISTHAPLAGRDLAQAVCLGAIQDFNPRAPCGARLQAGQNVQFLD